MTIRIPQNTQKYLAMMLENKIQANRGERLFDNIEGYRQKYISEIATVPTQSIQKTPEQIAAEKTEQLKTSLGKALKGTEDVGGFGSGDPTPKSQKSKRYLGHIGRTPIGFGVKDPTEIMFGDMSAGDIATAGGMYAGGALAGWLSGLGGSKLASKVAGKEFKSLIGKAGGPYAAGILKSLGGQIEDITGKSWVDAQLGNIARGQLGLVAQGAGRPWVPFVMPGQKISKPIK